MMEKELLYASAVRLDPKCIPSSAGFDIAPHGRMKSNSNQIRVSRWQNGLHIERRSWLVDPSSLYSNMACG